jgi:hypothetical protein
VLRNPSNGPDIVAIALENEENDRAEGWQGQIRQARLVIEPQAQAGIKLADFGRGVCARYGLLSAAAGAA